MRDSVGDRSHHAGDREAGDAIPAGARRMTERNSKMDRLSDQQEDGSGDAAERQGILVALFELIPEVLV